MPGGVVPLWLMTRPKFPPRPAIVVFGTVMATVRIVGSSWLMAVSALVFSGVKTGLGVVLGTSCGGSDGGLIRRCGSGLAAPPKTCVPILGPVLTLPFVPK